MDSDANYHNIQSQLKHNRHNKNGGRYFAIRLFIIGYDNCYDRINSIELS
jgi:hypothetical protein